jgi:hypothetical protein
MSLHQQNAVRYFLVEVSAVCQPFHQHFTLTVTYDRNNISFGGHCTLTIMQRLDTHHNDIQHYDTQLTTFGIKTLGITTISVTTKYLLLNVKNHPVMLSVVVINRCAESHSVQCRYTKCRHTVYAYCHCTERRIASNAGYLQLASRFLQS